MGVRFRGFVTAFVLACGLAGQSATAPAMIIDLVREGFNDITVPVGQDEIKLVDVNPLLLPNGIEFEGSTNVRRVDNTINQSGGNNGFHQHFTSNFLVLGDDSGQIGGTPTNDVSRIRIPFVIPANAIQIIISYRDAFTGTDTNPSRTDEFIVRLTGPGQTQEIELRESPGDFGNFAAHTGIAAIFDVFNDADPATVSPGTYDLVFRLNESAGGDTNTAVGLDRIRVRAEVIPEPSVLALLIACGGAGFLVSRRRPRSERVTAAA